MSVESLESLPHKSDGSDRSDVLFLNSPMLVYNVRAFTIDINMRTIHPVNCYAKDVRKL
jgi:hypothetical protein